MVSDLEDFSEKCDFFLSFVIFQFITNIFSTMLYTHQSLNISFKYFMNENRSKGEICYWFKYIMYNI